MPHDLAINKNSVRELAHNITDWNGLLETAEKCRATPLLYDRLFKSEVTTIPAQVCDKLKRSVITNTARNARLVQALADAMEALSNAKVYALPYKGPVLAIQAYDNPSLRVYDDLDIIVHKGDFRKAKEILVNIGYREIHKLPQKLENSCFRPKKPYTLQSKDNTHNIDLADRLTNNFLPFEISANNLWENTRSLTIDGHNIKTMSTECLIVYLCAHGAKHLWCRLIWISDIAGLLLNHDTNIDWGKAIQIAKAQDGMRMLLTGIQLAHNEYGVNIPSQLKVYIRKDPKVKSLCCEIQQIIYKTPGHLGFNKYKRAILYLQIRQRLRSRLHSIMLLAGTLNKRDRAVIKLPIILYPVYYLIRPLRLLAKIFSRR